MCACIRAHACCYSTVSFHASTFVHAFVSTGNCICLHIVCHAPPQSHLSSSPRPCCLLSFTPFTPFPPFSSLFFSLFASSSPYHTSQDKSHPGNSSPSAGLSLFLKIQSPPFPLPLCALQSLKLKTVPILTCIILLWRFDVQFDFSTVSVGLNQNLYLPLLPRQNNFITDKNN